MTSTGWHGRPTSWRSPRPLVRAGVLEDYGRALLAAGDLTGGGERLDQAWALYDEAGARGCRSAVQQAMRAAGIRRSWWASAQPRPSDGWASLTEAEIRVARLIADGHTNKSAAAQLGVSANTVGTHLRSVFAKLDVRSRVQLTNLLHAREPEGLTREPFTATIQPRLVRQAQAAAILGLMRFLEASATGLRRRLAISAARREHRAAAW